MKCKGVTHGALWVTRGTLEGSMRVAYWYIFLDLSPNSQETFRGEFFMKIVKILVATFDIEKLSSQFFYQYTVVCISLETRIHYLAVVSIFVKIKKLLIYGLKDLKICHKFQH